MNALKLIGRELRHLASCAWQTFRGVSVVSSGCVFLLFLGVFLWELPQSTEFSLLDVPLATLAYVGFGIYVGMHLGAFAALARTLWEMLGIWVLYPLAIAPPLCFVVLLVFAPLLASLGTDLFDAFKVRAAELDYMIPGDVGVAARTGVGALFAIVHLVIGTGAYLLSWKVLLALLTYLLAIALCLFTVAVAVVGFTGPVLGYVWVRRLRRRHSN